VTALAKGTSEVRRMIIGRTVTRLAIHQPSQWMADPVACYAGAAC
jgi:hypothetical protein